MDKLKAKLNSNPRLKRLVHWLIIPANDFRPRWWVRKILNPLIHKKVKELSFEEELVWISCLLIHFTWEMTL